MKIFKILVVFFSSCIPLLTASAQQPTPSQPPIAAATVSPPSFKEQIRNSVGFLTVTYVRGPSMGGIIGTCFFIFFPDSRLGENQGFIYLITNKHVARPGIDLGTPYTVSGVSLRLNVATGQGKIQSVQEQIPLDDTIHWYFPSDEAVDLAILPLAPDQKRYAYQPIPYSLIATSDKVKAGDVLVGDRVTFAGYFSSFPGQIRIEPIVREGVIAMIPDENLDTTLHKPGRLYLADLHAFHGNSGSPVFVNVSSTPHHGTINLGESYLLLGLISGYYPESVGYSVPAATVLTGEVRDNSGIATIVPAAELDNVLNSKALREERDRQVALLGMKQ
jgi:hypothetical protein